MSRWRFCVISFVYDTHPIHLQRQPRRFAEFPVFLGQPVNSGLCRRGVPLPALQPLSDLPALDRPSPSALSASAAGWPHRPCNAVPHIRSPDGRRYGPTVHRCMSARIRHPQTGICGGGSWLLQAVHITQAAHLIDTGVFIPGSVEYTRPCHALWFCHATPVSLAPLWADTSKMGRPRYSALCSVYLAQSWVTPVITARRAATSIWSRCPPHNPPPAGRRLPTALPLH